MALKIYTCRRCGHKWSNRKGAKPHVCPNKTCHSYLWEMPKNNIKAIK